MNADTITLHLTKDQLAVIQMALVERQCDIERVRRDPHTPAASLPFWEEKRASLTEVILLVAKA